MGSERDRSEWSRVAAQVREQASRRDHVPRELHAAALRLAGRLHGRRVLDVGCGHGALARVLAERGAQVLGIDASAERVREAQRLAREAGTDPTPGFRLAVASDSASLPEAPFDLITALLALDPGAKPVRELRSLARALRAGGRLVAGFEHPYAAGAAPRRPLEALFQSLRDVGLRVVDLVEPAGDDDAEPRFLLLLCERRGRRARERHRRARPAPSG